MAGAAPNYERRQRIAELVAQGLSYAAIARQLGVTHQAVQQLATLSRHNQLGEVYCKTCKRVIARGI